METNRSRLLADEESEVPVLPRLHLPDAASAAEGMLDKALLFCAEKMHLYGAETALRLLRQGNGTARWYAHHSLAEQVAEILGELDDTVQSVFVYDLDATPEDLIFGEEAPTSPIHMIVRTQRKTQALSALISAMESSLLEEYACRVGPGRLKYLLDVQLIDAVDVQKRRGYASLLSSLHRRPIQVWQREEEQDAS